MSYLLVTGMPRSGTTLVDKLLSLHPRAIVLSQPLPLLYVNVKRAYLEAAGTGERSAAAAGASYPLNDMFGGNYYPAPSLVEFLEGYLLSRAFCRETLEQMIPFSGQYTKPEKPLRVLDGYRPVPLFSFVTRYAEQVAGADRPPLVGSKETYCEEFVPYFLDRGARVLQIVRDPRDVITSLEHGRGRNFGGDTRPLLFNIRQWRKSVAFALAHAADPAFLSIRYEDLARDPRRVLGRVFGFLGLEDRAAEILAGDLRSQSGQLWQSNSSYFSSSRVTDRSVGRYREHLSPETDRFVQACCLMEMRELGYQVTIDREAASRVLQGWVATEPLARPELAAWMWDDERRAEEEARLERLAGGSFEPSLFIFESAFSRLSARALS